MVIVQKFCLANVASEAHSARDMVSAELSESSVISDETDTLRLNIKPGFICCCFS